MRDVTHSLIHIFDNPMKLWTCQKLDQIKLPTDEGMYSAEGAVSLEDELFL